MKGRCFCNDDSLSCEACPFGFHSWWTRTTIIKGWTGGSKECRTAIKNWKDRHFFSSPYTRAIETIQVAADEQNRPIQTVDAFKERCLSETPVDDFEEAIQKVWQNEYFAWEGGESNKDAQKRGVDATLQLLNKYADKKIVIGTHGNIMVLIMSYFDKRYDFSFWKSLTMPDIYKLEFDGSKLISTSRLWQENL